MKPLLLRLTGAILGALMVVLVPGAAFAEGGGSGLHVVGNDNEDAIVASAFGNGPSDNRAGDPGGIARSTVVVDDWAPACSGNGALNNRQITCAAAMNCQEGPEFVRYYHWSITVDLTTRQVVEVTPLAAECRSTPPDAVPVVAPDLVRRAMERLPLPKPAVQVKPSPLTLVNFKTGFWVEVQAQTFDITLLGQPVQVRATPVSYTYDFGDGETLGPTEDAGTPYPHPSITHTYRDDGDVHAHVSVTYRGEFRVGGSGWAPVPGTVTVDGPSVQIQVRQAHAQLVS